MRSEGKGDAISVGEGKGVLVEVRGGRGGGEKCVDSEGSEGWR